MPLTQLGRWTVVYTIVGLEVAAGGVCYYYWRRMNSSQGAYVHVLPDLCCLLYISVVVMNHNM